MGGKTLLVFLFLCTLHSVHSHSCGETCYSTSTAAHKACWKGGKKKPNCHVIRCTDNNTPFRQWSCAPKWKKGSSPRPSPSPAPLKIARGCRNICRYLSALAFDDCLYKNRTVQGCHVKRCPAPGKDFPGWVCAPKEQSTSQLSEGPWSGSGTITVTLLKEEGGKFLKSAKVTAKLADDISITRTKRSVNGVVTFKNVPDRTILIEARGSGNEIGSFGVLGSEKEAFITMKGFKKPSLIDNNDFSKGVAGWEKPPGNSVKLVKHVENVGPTRTKTVSRFLINTSSRQTNSMNQNLKIQTRTDVEGSVSVSRTFTTSPDTKGVMVRYRFVTDEYPDWYLSRFNDMFCISIRTKTQGTVAWETASMNGLGAKSFDSNGSTSWRSIFLNVEHKSEIVQVDVLVANVGDGLYQSFVEIDFIQETK